MTRRGAWEDGRTSPPAGSWRVSGSAAGRAAADHDCRWLLPVLHGSGSSGGGGGGSAGSRDPAAAAAADRSSMTDGGGTRMDGALRRPAPAAGSAVAALRCPPTYADVHCRLSGDRHRPQGQR